MTRNNIDELETDGNVDDQTTRWFQGILLNAITALDEADRDDQLRIEGRLFVLRDLFGLSEEELVELADAYGQGEEMAALLNVDYATDTQG